MRQTDSVGSVLGGFYETGLPGLRSGEILEVGIAEAMWGVVCEDGSWMGRGSWREREIGRVICHDASCASSTVHTLLPL